MQRPQLAKRDQRRVSFLDAATDAESSTPSSTSEDKSPLARLRDGKSPSVTEQAAQRHCRQNELMRDMVKRSLQFPAATSAN